MIKARPLYSFLPQLFTMQKLLPILLIGVCLAACQTGPQKILSSTIVSRVEAEGPPLPEAVLQQKKDWTDALNTGTAEDLEAFYWKDAGLLWGRNLFREGALVANQWKHWQTALGSLQRQGIHTVVKHDDRRYFEMGYYEFGEEDPTIYAYVVVWKMLESRWLRELEVVEPLFDQQEVQPKAIEKARSLWVERSNAHDPEALAAKSYAGDGFYVNQGNFYQGKEAIGQVYSYMSRPDWEIELIPRAVLPVQTGLAYELGQYKSTGTGHYLIIWELHAAGTWKVLLDFNF